MNIGLLEDDAAISEYLAIALKLAGHRVIPYTQPSSFLAALQLEDSVTLCALHDVVIVDLWLQGSMQGLDVVLTVREVLTQKQLPIIFISATSQDEINWVHDHHPDIPILRKPFSTKALLQVIEAYIG